MFFCFIIFIYPVRSCFSYADCVMFWFALEKYNLEIIFDDHCSVNRLVARALHLKSRIGVVEGEGAF